MATALKPIGHEDRLTIVDHLDELRSRLVICAVTLAVAFGLCFWQNSTLLDVLNKPLKDSTPTAQDSKGNGRLAQVAAAQQEVQKGLAATAKSLRVLARLDNLTPAQSARSPPPRRRRAPRPSAAEDDAEARPDHHRRRRAVHGDADGRRVLRAAVLAAGAALPGVRVRAAGVQPAGAAGRAADDADGAGAVPRRRGVRLLPRAAAGDLVPAELQHDELRRPDPGEGLLPLRRCSRCCRPASCSSCRWDCWRSTRSAS